MYHTALSLYCRFTSFLLAAYYEAPDATATPAPSSGHSKGLYIGVFLLYLLIAAVFVLAIIPARIARRKGYSFALFYWFGVAAFIPALIVANCIHDCSVQTDTARAQAAAVPQTPVQPAAVNVPQQVQEAPLRAENSYAAAAANAGTSVAEELKKLKELLDANVISEAEFQEAKSKLLAKL